MPELNRKNLRNLFLLIAGAILLYWLLHETERVSKAFSAIKGVLSPFIIGSVLAFILNVPMRAMERLLRGIKKDGLRRVIAVLIVTLIALLVLALVFWLLIPQLIQTVEALAPQIYDFVMDLGAKVNHFLENNPEVMEWVTENTDFEKFDWANLAQKAISLVGNSVSAIVTKTFSALGSVLSGVVNAVIAIVFAVYCLFQKETLARQGRKVLYAFLPEKAADYSVDVLRLSNSTFSNFLSGQCVEVCILGSMFAVTMTILRMPYVPLVSVLVAVTAFIPVVGAWVGCAVGAFFILVVNPMLAVWFVVMFVVLQQIENNLIYPHVVGTSIGLSGMWVLIAVAVGGDLMGVVGMFLMIPFASVLYTLIRRATHKRLENRRIAEEKLTPQPPELRSGFREKRKMSKKNKQEDKTQ